MINKKKYIIGVLLFFLCNSCLGNTVVEQGMRILKEWETYCNNTGAASPIKANPVHICMQAKNDNEPMYVYSSKLINLGPAMLPAIISYLENHTKDYDNFKASCFPYVVRRIGKVQIMADSDPNGDYMFYSDFPEIKNSARDFYTFHIFHVVWFKNIWKYAPATFESQYAKLLRLKKLNEFSEAKETYQHITDIGIVNLPLMIEKLKSGDIDFIPAISTLTDGKVKENSTVENCLSWWEEHKNEYLVFPGQEKLRE